MFLQHSDFVHTGTQEERTAVMRAAQHGHFVAGFDLHDVESEVSNCSASQCKAKR